MLEFYGERCQHALTLGSICKQRKCQKNPEKINKPTRLEVLYCNDEKLLNNSKTVELVQTFGGYGKKAECQSTYLAIPRNAKDISIINIFACSIRHQNDDHSENENISQRKSFKAR